MRLSALFLTLLLLIVAGCSSSPRQGASVNSAFAKPKAGNQRQVDRISESGELIIATISSPTTYFDYQGVGLGLQYALAENFAETLGVGVRVELANDTTQLVKMLDRGDVDLIALQLPEDYCERHKLLMAGAVNAKQHTGWAVKAGADELAQALDDWYGDGVEISVERQEKRRFSQRGEVRRTVRAPFISRERGIISIYDRFFQEAARYTGWDWRLIAAQCYQESGFDPNAVSWAGAKGLMQIMPSTARQLGLADADAFEPMHNIAAAARLIRTLQGQWNDVPDAEERVKFVLASYNGGQGHIRDAMALARKHGGDPHRWSDVAYFIRALSDPRYYRDPVVRHGYMIGGETAGYVESVMERWRQYGGSPTDLGRPSGSLPSASPSPRGGTSAAQNEHRRNRFSKSQRILSPDELEKASGQP